MCSGTIWIEFQASLKQTGIEGLSQSEESGIKNDKTPLDRVAAGFGQGSAVTTLQLDGGLYGNL